MTILKHIIDKNLVKLEEAIAAKISEKLEPKIVELEKTFLKRKCKSEQKFIDKHKILKHPDRAGNKDDVYQATNVQGRADYETMHDQHGYLPGEDDEVYEAEDIKSTLTEMSIRAISKIREAKLKNKYSDDAKANHNKLERASKNSAKHKLGKM